MRDAEIVKSSSGITSRHQAVRVCRALGLEILEWLGRLPSSFHGLYVLSVSFCHFGSVTLAKRALDCCFLVCQSSHLLRCIGIGKEAFFLVHHATPLSAQEYFRKKAPGWGSMAPCHVICFFVLNSKAASRDRAVVPLRHGTIGSLSL